MIAPGGSLSRPRKRLTARGFARTRTSACGAWAAIAASRAGRLRCR
jgi:hypothetical protein